MFSNLSLRKKILVLITLLITATGIAVGGMTFSVVSSYQVDDVIKRQHASLRVAASILKKSYPSLRFSVGDKGEVSRITFPNIPQFDTHTIIDEIGMVTGETATVFVWEDENRDFWRRTTNIIKPDGARAVGTNLGQKGKVYPVVTKGDTYNGEATILGIDYYTIYEPIFDTSGKVIGILYAGIKKEKIDAHRADIALTIFISFLVTVIIASIITTRSSKIMFAPLSNITTTINRLSNDELSVDIAHVERQDEIGEIARAVEIFKDRLLENRQLAEESRRAEIEKQHQAEKVRAKEEETNRLLAEKEEEQRQKRHQQMLSLADQFEGAVLGVVQEVAKAVGKMENATDRLRDVSGETSAQATTVSTAANEASRYVNAMAAATEELSASINEISQQADFSSNMSTKAVSRVSDARKEVDELVEFSSKISGVVELINDIAEQTNLLALNATIEAARAGDAGSGFAVVASEVKSLALQTAKATQEIGEQIDAMQNVAAHAKGGMEDVQKSITEVSQTISQMAAAILEQDTATQGIAQNAQEVSGQTNEVTHNITGVSEGTNTTGDATQEVVESLDFVNTETKALETEVRKFIAVIREN